MATLTVVLPFQSDSAPSLHLVIGALNGLVSAGVWAGLRSHGGKDPVFEKARSILEKELRRDKAAKRFYPEFGDSRSKDVRSKKVRSKDVRSKDERKWFTPPEALKEFDPGDPFDAAVRDALNSYLRRTLCQADPALAVELFGFARVTRVEHNSPLLVELALFIAMGIAIPMLVVLGGMRAAFSLRKQDVELEIRSIQRDTLQEELRQKKLQTRIIAAAAEVAEELDIHEFPHEAIAEGAQISTTAVHDLGTSPLIGSLTLGLSTKTGS